MARKSRKTLISERIDEIKATFVDMPIEKMRLVIPAIERLAIMEYYIRDLEKQVDETGFVETYTNGPNQSGTRESIVSRSYSTMIKNYNSLVKTIISLLPDDKQQEATDGFEEFLQRKK